MKNIYTLITPDDREIILGVFTTERKAIGYAKRTFAPDWLSLACYPIIQRPLKKGEKIKAGDQWTG
jgi:hypothetical protein